jgi:hypothetical protein
MADMTYFFEKTIQAFSKPHRRKLAVRLIEIFKTADKRLDELPIG